MRAGDAARRDALRLLRAALKNAEIERRRGEGGLLEERDVRAVIQKQIKQRRDSIEQFRKGNREDLASKEEAELAIFQSYLPQAMDEATMRAAVAAVIAETGAQSPKEMGKVMSVAVSRLGEDRRSKYARRDRPATPHPVGPLADGCRPAAGRDTDERRERTIRTARQRRH